MWPFNISAFWWSEQDFSVCVCVKMVVGGGWSHPHCHAWVYTAPVVMGDEGNAHSHTRSHTHIQISSLCTRSNEEQTQMKSVQETLSQTVFLPVLRLYWWRRWILVCYGCPHTFGHAGLIWNTFSDAFSAVLKNIFLQYFTPGLRSMRRTHPTKTTPAWSVFFVPLLWVLGRALFYLDCWNCNRPVVFRELVDSRRLHAAQKPESSLFFPLSLIRTSDC